MLDNNLLEDVISKTLSCGGEYADIFIERREQTSIVIEDQKLEKIITGTKTGAGIRLLSHGKTFYAFSNDLSERALLQAASEASKSASGKKGKVVIDLETNRPRRDFFVKELPENVALKSKIKIVRTIDNAARGFDSRIKQVSAIYRDAVQKVQMANSEGSVTEDVRIYTTAVVQVIAVQDFIVQTGYEPIGGFIGFELFEQHDVEAISLKAARRAVMMLSARKAPGGRMPVVITSRAGVTMIHEAIWHGLEADLAQQGLSVFSNKKGIQVASKLITVIDDATLPYKRGSFCVDDEGIPSQRTILVENGILQNYMYDRLSAMKDGSLSTGNGRRESYQHRPIPRMTNTFIQEGISSPEQVVSSLDKGILVEKMGGGQVNTVTGDFVFDVQEGYLIEKGKKSDPIRGATLTGNGPQILMSIDMVGNDLGYSIGTCGKDSQSVPVSDAMPTIRIPEMVVGGAVDE
jgi:TldD protein